MKKRYKLVFICLGIYAIIMAVIIFINQSNKNKGVATIFIDNYSKWIYSDQKWAKIPDSEIEDYSWKKYDIYQNQKFIGNNYLMNSEGQWYIFDNNRKSISWERGTIAYGGDIKIENISYTSTNMTNKEYAYANRVLKQLNIKDVLDENTPLKKKYLIDLDNDGTKEEIFAISNTYQDMITPTKVYSIVFLRKNNKNTVIYRSIEKFKTHYQGCRPSISTAFKINKDNNPKIAISCTFFSAVEVNNYLYEYNNKTTDFKNILIDFTKLKED